MNDTVCGVNDTQRNELRAPVFSTPIVNDFNGSEISRTESIDSCLSKISAEPYPRDCSSRLSTKSALSALFAAVDVDQEDRESSYVLYNETSIEYIGCASRDIHPNEIHIENSYGTTDMAHTSSFPSGEGLNRSASGSRSFHSKSHSRSNSISQASIHSNSENSISLRPRSTRIDDKHLSLDGPSSFSAHMRNDSFASSLNNAHESARRILSSASFDSDFSDGGIGIEYNTDNIRKQRSSTRRRRSSYSTSEGEEEVHAIDDFHDFENYNTELKRSYDGLSDSGGEEEGDEETSRRDSINSNHTNNNNNDKEKEKNNPHMLTCRQVLLLLLNTEVLFEAKTSSSAVNMAASFIKSSRDSLFGLVSRATTTTSTTAATSTAPATTSNNKENNPDQSNPTLSTVLQQNLANAAASLPAGRRRPPKPPHSTHSQPSPTHRQNRSRSTSSTTSARLQQQQHESEMNMLFKRLCIFPAEDDGSPMDDLPEYSSTTNILQSGLDDFAVLDKHTKACLFQLKLEGRLDDDCAMLIDASELDNRSRGDYCGTYSNDYHTTMSPSEKAIHEGEQAIQQHSSTNTTTNTTTSNKNNKVVVGSTVEVLQYDKNNIELNPVYALGCQDNDLLFAPGFDRSHSESTYRTSSSASDDDFRAKFSRERSGSCDNDVIQMFRTETDEMLQSKVEEAMSLQQQNNSITIPPATTSTIQQQDSGKHNNNHHHSSKYREKPTVYVEDRNTVYITVLGRKDSSAEYKVLLKIPVFNNRPHVTLPNWSASTEADSTTTGTTTTAAGVVVGGLGIDIQQHHGYTDPLARNPRDIAIASPTKRGSNSSQTSSRPASGRFPTPPRSSRGAHVRNLSGQSDYWQDKDLLVSAVLRALEQDQQQQPLHSLSGHPSSEIDLDITDPHYYHQHTSGRTSPRSQRTSLKIDTGHNRGSSFDFTGSFDLLAGRTGITPDAERRNSHKLRGASIDSVASENYVLNPHTSNNAISFFAIPSGNTPTATPKKMPSKASSNNSSGSNLIAAMLAQQQQQLQQQHDEGFTSTTTTAAAGIAQPNAGYAHQHNYSYYHHNNNNNHQPQPQYSTGSVSGTEETGGIATSTSTAAADVIQVVRHSRSNSFLTENTATHRSSISSEFSDAPHSVLHSQYHHTSTTQQQASSGRHSGRSVNFFTSANLGGGGFSSDDCSDGGSSSSDSDTYLREYATDGTGRPARRTPASAGSRPLSIVTSGPGSNNSSGSRTPQKKTSPIGAHSGSTSTTGRSHTHMPPPGISHSIIHQKLLAAAADVQQSTATTTVTASAGSSMEDNTPYPHSAAAVASLGTTSGQRTPPNTDTSRTTTSNNNDNNSNNHPTSTNQGEKSSFYFLSRLFGTFRRSTASTITPRASAVKIAIIHEAEFEDSDSSCGSGKSSPSKEYNETDTIVTTEKEEIETRNSSSVEEK